MEGLVLSGGGSRGSWECGVLKYLGEVRERGYDYGGGTSIGAINIAGLSQFKPEDFKNGTGWVYDMWTKHVTKTSDIWHPRRPLGIPALWNMSLGKSDPAQYLIRTLIDHEKVKASGMQVRVTTVDMLTATLKEYTQDSPDFIDGVIASAAFPVALPPIWIGDRLETDGGVRDIAPLGAAIRAGCDKITLVVVKDLEHLDTVTEKDIGWIAPFALRVVNIQSYDILQNDVKVCGLYNKFAALPDIMRDAGASDAVIDATMKDLGVSKKPIELTVITPTKKLHTSLDFSGDVMQAQIKQGYSDAKLCLEGANA